MNPGKQSLAIRRSTEGEKSSLRICWTVLKDRNQCCEFYSKDFVRRLGELLTRSDDGLYTHRLYGKINMRKDRIFFDLGHSELIIEEPEADRTAKTEETAECV